MEGLEEELESLANVVWVFYGTYSCRDGVWAG